MSVSSPSECLRLMAPFTEFLVFPLLAAAGQAFGWVFPKLMGVHSLASAGDIRVFNHYLDTTHQSIGLVGVRFYHTSMAPPIPHLVVIFNDNCVANLHVTALPCSLGPRTKRNNEICPSLQTFSLSHVVNGSQIAVVWLMSYHTIYKKLLFAALNLIIEDRGIYFRVINKNVKIFNLTLKWNRTVRDIFLKKDINCSLAKTYNCI